MKIKNFLLILAIIFSKPTVAQNFSEVDSLIEQIAFTDDSLKADLYNKICWKLRVYNPNKAIKYGQKALEISKKLNQPNNTIKAYSYCGVCAQKAGDFSKALEYYDIGYTLAAQNNNLEQLAYANINLGNLYLYLNNASKSIEYLSNAVPLGIQLNDSAIQAYCHLNLGRAYLQREEGIKAKKELETALELRIKSKQEHGSILTIKKYIGDADILLKDTTAAIKCYKQIELLTKNCFDYSLLSNVFNSMANIYYSKNELDTALVYAQKSLFYGEKVGAKYRIKNAYKIMGDVYMAQKNYTKAKDAFKNEATYGDSVFNDNLNQSLISIKYANERYKKQTEIDMLDKERKIQKASIYTLVIFIQMVVLILLSIIANNRKIKKLNKELDLQKNELEKTNEEIKSSIRYAMRIQRAAVNSNDNVKQIFPDSMVFYKPKDIVSGDWYRIETHRGKKIIVEADCTGHGVPGSLLSMMGISALKDTLNSMDLKQEELLPATILNNMRKIVKSTFSGNSEDGLSMSDGMDMAIGIIDPQTKKLTFAAAYQTAILIRNGKSIKLKGDRMPIGNHFRTDNFTNQDIQLQQGDALFFMSDGIKDQTNPDFEKFKSTRLDTLLIQNASLPMIQICTNVQKCLETWQGNSEQVDDITMIGIKI